MAKQEDPDKLERLYEARKEGIREIIDECASRSRKEMDEHGAITDVADTLGVNSQRVSYVMNKWANLVEHRRNAQVNPLDSEAVKDAYDDETLKAMAGNNEVAADGFGNATVPIELELDEIFRCMKLLPGDLGMKFFAQTMERSDELPRDGIQKLFEHK